MNGKWLRILLLGLFNGLLLGSITKWFELLSGLKVYQLLLNVDFIPVVGEFHWNEAWLFTFHLITSLFITMSYAYMIRRRRIVRRLPFALLFIVPAVLLYFPLSFLSKIGGLLPFDLSAFSLWALSHFIYALFLPLSIQK
ncbi:hypothetical protein ACQKL5_07120 [Peribacillus sp. NPDC097675]|uniref:hypothetical protein n=1 Tax=Peribacillus sp. NPDC097675 TaxID=3390618 RepID=UPI003CFC69EB